MNGLKECVIFYYPGVISKKPTSGSAQRPYKMLMALREKYSVYEITGELTVRRKKIKELVKLIKEGKQIKCLYGEFKTTPLIYSNGASDVSLSYLYDFWFLSFCKRHNVDTSIYIRDLFWQFDAYKRQVPLYKRLMFRFFYYFDFMLLTQLVTRIFLPTESIKAFLPVVNPEKVGVLPPGCDDLLVRPRALVDNKIRIIYVGGFGFNYDLAWFVKDIPENVQLTLCIRPEDVANINFSTERITVLHLSSGELPEEYEKHDLAIVPINKSPYLDVAMPIKVMEAVGNEVPIITTDLKEVSDFVLLNNIGWIIDPDIKSFSTLIDDILSDRTMLEEKKAAIRTCKQKNLWGCRVDEACTGEGTV